MITEEQIRQTVSKAEELFQNCWAKSGFPSPGVSQDDGKAV
jgi:hypothetical protein